jgi:nucleoside-diphosphate-sugar epimerase
MQSRRKQILILGARGFVGRALTARLKKTPNRVFAMTRKDGDLSNIDFCQRTFKNKDVIFYLAASRKNITEHATRPFDFVSDNTLPLLTVLVALKTLPPKTFVYVSSVLAEYATDDTGITDGYAVAKYIGELIVRAFEKQTGWKVKIVRSAAVYGPEKTSNPKIANVIPAMIYRIRKSDKEFVMWGTGKRKLQFIHIDDLTANLAAVGLGRTPPFIVVGNPETVSVNQLAKMIMKKLGKKLRITHDRSKHDKPTKLFQFTNPITPRIHLPEGLDALIYG